MVVTDDEMVEQVSGYDFTVRFSDEDSPEAQQRWERRVDTLAAWLLEKWQRERQNYRNN